MVSKMKTLFAKDDLWTYFIVNFLAFNSISGILRMQPKKKPEPNTTDTKKVKIWCILIKKKTKIVSTLI